MTNNNNNNVQVFEYVMNFIHLTTKEACTETVFAKSAYQAKTITSKKWNYDIKFTQKPYKK